MTEMERDKRRIRDLESLLQAMTALIATVIGIAATLCTYWVFK